MNSEQLAQLWLDAKRSRRVLMIGGARYVPEHGLSPEIEELISAVQRQNKGCSLQHACRVAAQRWHKQGRKS